MKIFTSNDIRRIDQTTIQHEGIRAIDLMERAANAITYEIVSRWRASKRIVIFAGPGNNGGDALAVARMLHEQGYRPELYLFNIPNTHLSECCQINRDRLLELEDFDFTEVVRSFMPPELGPGDVVIDGLFGSGLSRPLNDSGLKAVVQLINDSGAYIVAIDMPSGMFGEWNSEVDHRNIINADLTLTFQFKRLSFFLAENAKHVGECKVLNLDLSDEAIAKTPTNFYLIEHDDVHRMMRTIDPFANKYDMGTVLLVAGSYGMMGAGILSANAAMRSGAGLVTVHAPRCGYAPMQCAAPEALFEADEHEYFTTHVELSHNFSVVALGPGIGINDETIDAVDSFIRSHHRLPIVLDADALNCIALRPVLLRCIPKGSVLTPHNGEFDRLFGGGAKQHMSAEERLKKAIEVSRLYEVTIVLKGRYSMVVRPDGKVYINSTGNAGMATAGSGDVLTGIIASMIAQGYSTDLAVVLAVYIHGLAGDMAAEKTGQHGLIAGDIVAHIGPAIEAILRQ